MAKKRAERRRADVTEQQLSVHELNVEISQLNFRLGRYVRELRAKEILITKLLEIVRVLRDHEDNDLAREWVPPPNLSDAVRIR